jgi:hypothetical protein
MAAPKRGNTAGINDAIVAEIIENTLYICLFKVEIVVEVTVNTLFLNKLIVDNDVEVTESNFANTLCNATVATSVTT